MVLVHRLVLECHVLQVQQRVIFIAPVAAGALGVLAIGAWRRRQRWLRMLKGDLADGASILEVWVPTQEFSLIQTKAYDSVAAQDWFQVTGFRPDIFWAEVAGNDDQVGSNLGSSAFVFSQERVAVSPNFEVVAEHAVVLVEVFDDDHLVSVVPIPPLVAHLHVGFWEGLARGAALASARAAIEPQVLFSGIVQWGLQLDVLLNLLQGVVVLDVVLGNDLVNRALARLFARHLPFFRVSGSSVLRGCRAHTGLMPLVVFFAVGDGPGDVEDVGDVHARAPEPAFKRSIGLGVFETGHALEVLASSLWADLFSEEDVAGSL